MDFPQHVIERFWRKVDKSGGPDACWPWTAFRNGKNYGLFSPTHSRSIGAHRYALACTTGKLPDKFTLALHSCDNPPCCNPKHLRWGTPKDNTQDCISRGRNWVQLKWKYATHCKRGHELAVVGTFSAGTSNRRCKACFYIYQERSRARQYINEMKG